MADATEQHTFEITDPKTGHVWEIPGASFEDAQHNYRLGTDTNYAKNVNEYKSSSLPGWGTGARIAAQGIPVAGHYIGDTSESSAYKYAHPNISTGLQVAGAIPTGLAMAAAGPIAAPFVGAGIGALNAVSNPNVHGLKDNAAQIAKEATLNAISPAVGKYVGNFIGGAPKIANFAGPAGVRALAPAASTNSVSPGMAGLVTAVGGGAAVNAEQILSALGANGLNLTTPAMLGATAAVGKKALDIARANNIGSYGGNTNAVLRNFAAPPALSAAGNKSLEATVGRPTGLE